MNKKTIDIEIKTNKQTISVPVSKIVSIELSEKRKPFLYFDALDDESFRMTYTKGMFKEFDL